MKKSAILLTGYLMLSSFPGKAQEITIGKENLNIDVFQKDQNYSYTQTIYKQEWIHAEGTINKIAFYLGYSEGPVLTGGNIYGSYIKGGFRGWYIQNGLGSI